MTVEELIKCLYSQDRNAKVMILDQANGGGVPRDLNYGPILRCIDQEDADECGDCEGLVAEEVVVLGFGCY